MLMPTDDGLGEPIEGVVGLIEAECDIIMDRNNMPAKFLLNRTEALVGFIEAPAPVGQMGVDVIPTAYRFGQGPSLWL